MAYIVKNAYDDKYYFDNLPEAEAAYFDELNYCEFVMLLKVGPGLTEIVRQSF